jgi:SAM-dependent methyltransferase
LPGLEVITFQDREQAGWVERAGRYRDLYGTLTSQAIAPLFEALGDLDRADFLDIACGTGELADAAARRGARAHGVDFADAMVINARARYPDVEFRAGDAQDLPNAQSSFDAATCAFAVAHFADPERALRNARRVLRSGGRFALTTWCGPQQGGEFFAFVDGIIAELGTPDVGLPEPPPGFRFADSVECRRCLAAAGFGVTAVRVLDLVWSCFSARAIPEMIESSMVWTSRVLRSQRPEIRDRIARAIDAAGEARRRGGKIAFRFPALLVAATAC